jgi:hypothetical protein
VRTTPLAFVFLLSLRSIAAADIITQTVPFDYDANVGFASPVLQGFDTLGGARMLRSVTFEFRHNFTVELYVESTGPTPVSADDFNLSISYNTLFQIGMGEGSPFFGPGAFFVENASGDLGAYDGVPGNDGPDSYRRTLTDAFVVSQTYGQEDPAVLAAVTIPGEISTGLAGFNELFFNWINDPNWPPPPSGFPEYPGDAAVWVSFPSFRHFGEIEVTYDYVAVPAPFGAVLLGAPSILMASRRRR